MLTNLTCGMSVAFLQSQLLLIIFLKTSIPIDRKLKDQVSNRKFLEEDVLLEGDPLEEIFPLPKPAKKTLHIVVRHPRPRESSL